MAVGYSIERKVVGNIVNLRNVDGHQPLPAVRAYLRNQWSGSINKLILALTHHYLTTTIVLSWESEKRERATTQFLAAMDEVELDLSTPPFFIQL